MRGASNEPVPVSTLVDQVAIPHETFRLDNGLTVIVHEDRKAPVVGVSMWYNVGSKDEPAGKTGFAHLFEHLMFNGSENLDGDFFQWLQKIGATDYNGTTSFDRTNYFQTVPSGAIDRALFMESDRMGYLLGAVTQGTLDNQRGVVQNEKRQGENRPGGLVFEEVLKNLFPAGHPYSHTHDRIDGRPRRRQPCRRQQLVHATNMARTTRSSSSPATLMPRPRARWSRNISPPSRAARSTILPQAAIPTLPAPKQLVMKDRVATTSVSRYWTVPGPARPPAGRARCRRLGARRACQFALRQGAGA